MELKIKVSIGSAEIILEGEEGLVHTILNELREEGLGKLGSITNKQNNGDTIDGPTISPEIDSSNQADSSMEHENLPALKNVVLLGTPKTEAEWILVCALYCSNQGTKLFSIDDLRIEYEKTGRMTDTRKKNFTRNIKPLVTKEFIKAINDNDFRIERAGLERAKSLVFNKIEKNVPKSKPNSKKKTNSRKSSPPSYDIVNIDFSEDEKASLKSFWDGHSYSSNIDKAVLAAFWLKEKKSIKDFTANLFFTVLRIVDENTSFNLLSAIKNAKNQKQYYNLGSAGGTYTLNHFGEDRVKQLESA